MKSGLLYLLDILQLLSNESLEINDNIFAVGKHLPNTSFTIVMISAQNPRNVPQTIPAMSTTFKSY